MVSPSGLATRNRVTEDAKSCVAKGVFGVPTFLMDDRMYWRNDRLVLLEHYLSNRK